MASFLVYLFYDIIFSIGMVCCHPATYRCSLFCSLYFLDPLIQIFEGVTWPEIQVLIFFWILNQLRVRCPFLNEHTICYLLLQYRLLCVLFLSCFLVYLPWSELKSAMLASPLAVLCLPPQSLGRCNHSFTWVYCLFKYVACFFSLRSTSPLLNKCFTCIWHIMRHYILLVYLCNILISVF